MKLVILTLCVAGAFARPDVSHIVQKNDESQAQIVRQDLNVEPNGAYQWGIETSNGIVQNEQGGLDNPQAENAALRVQGQSSFKTPEGLDVELVYTADENGFQPQGSHLPTPPPIPEAILRSLEYLRAHPPPPEQP